MGREPRVCEVSSFMDVMKNRILALIDGFNYYHKLDKYFREYKEPVKWINYRSLLESILLENDDKDNAKVVYYSAISTNSPESRIIKHLTFIEALKTADIQVVLGKFKKKQIPKCYPAERCSGCDHPTCGTLHRHEEKETDVNIAIKLIEATLLDEYDKCFLFSGDGDFVSVVKRALELKPSKKIIIVPPPPPIRNNSIPAQRYSCAELIHASRNPAFLINFERIKKAQFPDTIDHNWKINFKFKDDAKTEHVLAKRYNAITNPWKV